MTKSNFNPMLELSDKYADELSAQFRTLNFFVNHAGEIGRAHETYLRGIIARFLPKRCNVGSGFVVSDDWVSPQQDIIIYDQLELPTLFEVGDCIVVDKEAVAALVEVKTSLKAKKHFMEAYQKAYELKKAVGSSRFVGLYAWEGLSLDSTKATIWDFIRGDPLNRLDNLPDAVYIRGSFLLMINLDGRRESPPFRLLNIVNNSSETGTSDSLQGISEGQALLALISEIWMGGLQRDARWPWWLDDWQKELPRIEKKIPWPDDLLSTI